MASNAAIESVKEMLTPHVEGMGYELVLVRLIDTHRKRLLQIFAEPNDGRAMTLGDCERISRTVSAVLDVEDPITSAYDLEVSSPGIDRPLVKRKDYERYQGHEAKIELAVPMAGRKRFTGTVMSVDEDDNILFRTKDNKEHVIPLAQIGDAKLTLTDKLIKEHLKAQKEHAGEIEMAPAINDNQPNSKDKT